jgi:hypothetical protein
MIKLKGRQEGSIESMYTINLTLEELREQMPGYEIKEIHHCKCGKPTTMGYLNLWVCPDCLDYNMQPKEEPKK